MRLPIPLAIILRKGSTLEEAESLCAVTTENAKCFPGDNPYILPRVRMRGTQTLEEFISAINKSLDFL